jgi:uncharacterized protein YkwD
MRSFVILCFLSQVEIDHPTIKQMLAHNNAIRQDKGLAANTFSESLGKAAQAHAWYMARQHDRGDEDFNHRGGNGTPGQRAAKHGYNGLVKENIGRGYKSVEAVFEAWLKSTQHKDALLSEMADAGFGYAIAKDGTTYWVAIYGKSRCSPDFSSLSPN